MEPPNNWSEYEELRTIFRSIKNTSFPTELDLHSYSRNTVDPFIYTLLKQKYGSVLQTHWDTCTIPKQSDRAIVIVERRCHPNLKFCLQNAAYFAPGFSIHVVCSKANENFVQHICGLQKNFVHIHPIFKDISTSSQGYLEYNELLKTTTFYDFFKEEYLLFMETDCYFLKKIPQSIFQYDYVASKWAWAKEDPGGGGISLRKRLIMKEICTKCLEDNKIGIPQDCFINTAIKKLNYKFPEEDKNVFFTESCFSYFVIGTHQWWTFLSQLPENEWYEIFKVYLELNL